MDNITITESRPNEVLAALHESAHAEREYLFASRDVEPADLVLVAWLGDEAVGYIAVTDQQPDGLLVWEHLVVPAHRNQGLGERLLLEAVRRTAPGVVVQVDPWSDLDLDRVADYYRRLGFTRESAPGRIWATATDVLRSAASRHATSSEAQTPISAILNEKEPGVITVAPDALVREAVSILNQNRIGAAVVSSDGSRIQGILSERDILIGLDVHGANFLDQPVSTATTTDVVTCVLHDPIATVMEIMTNRRVRHMPVTAAGSLVGIVSIGDLVNYRLKEVENPPPKPT
jgi:CBS domain-containing protein/GNAT superfamily N-acetyltransferase